MNHRFLGHPWRHWQIVFAILFAPVLCSSLACGRESTQKDVDPGGVAFAYTDKTGQRLLTLSDDNVVTETARARAMTMAVCSEGSAFPIRYLKLQERSAGDTGRQSDYNFDHDEGQLFEFARDRGKPSEPYFGETCLLLPDNYLQRFPISPNDLSSQEREARNNAYAEKVRESESRKQPMDLTPFQPVGDFAKGALARIEREKARAAVLYFPLHGIGASQQIAVVEFAPMGNELLASIVLAGPDRLSFFDMPASRKGTECWRADDNCILDLGTGREMEVQAVLGAEGEQLIFFTWWGPEGQFITLFQAKGGKLVEVKKAYRYHAPS